MIYYVKTILCVKPNSVEAAILEYLFDLISIDGKCKKTFSNKLITCLPVGVNLISREPPSSDLSVFNQIWIKKQYQPVIDLMKCALNVRSDVKIIDAGGNAGYTGLFFKEEFPNSCILILEPEASSFNLLEENVKLNGCQGIIALKAGLWKNEAHLEVQRDFRDGREWSYYAKEVPYSTELKGYGVADLLKKYEWEYIDLFKIDIEGGEKYLFESEEQARTFLSRTKFIAIEIHDEFNSRDKINKCLTDNRFEFFTAGELTIGRNVDYYA